MGTRIRRASKGAAPLAWTPIVWTPTLWAPIVWAALVCFEFGAGWTPTALALPTVVGCSDDTREGFASTDQYPLIASCAGGWTVPGIFTPKAPACGHSSGNSSANPDGADCAAEDLCAAGWHICVSGTEVAAKSPSGCDGAVATGTMFFATRQSGPGDSHCGSGTNDVFGCGTVGYPIYGPGCSALTRFGHNNCSALPAPWHCFGETTEALNVTKPAPEAGGVLCCKGVDTDDDGLPDTLEDHNMNGVVDPGETDPRKRDTDSDGLDDGEEDANLNGRRDRGETDPTRPDSDDDGLSDGIERGRRPDGTAVPDPSMTNPLVADTDKDGLPDGVEDANKNGAYDEGSETSPRVIDTDGDRLPDGCIDRGGDGCSAEDGEDLNLDGAQNGTETDPRVADTDGGGVGDGAEVRVDGTDPLLAIDDYTCEDGVRSGLETDVDCGGPVCTPCDEGQSCTGGADCDSGVCDLETGRCKAPTCEDGVRNGDETDVDCGGSCPKGCEDGQGCSANGDCTSEICDQNAEPAVCRAPGCDDGIHNGDESDVDCGGSCKPCEEGQQCREHADCITTGCDPESGTCVPLCPDGPDRSDCDNDGLRNEIEDKNRNGVVDPGETDPLEADSDEDGLADGHEDSNLNGIRDEGETDPTLADTDEGGVGDGTEVGSGTDPLDPSDDRVGGDGGVGDGGSSDSGSDAPGMDLTDARVVGGGCSVPGNLPGALGLPLMLLGLLLLGLGLLRRGARRRRGSGASGIALGLLLMVGLTPQARAQQFSVLRMRPAASPLNLYNTERGHTLPHLSPSVGFYMHYDGQPLQMVGADGQHLYNEVKHQFNMSLLAAFGLWDHGEIGVALPVTFVQGHGDRDPGAPAAPSLSAGIGDLRLIPKVRLYTVDFFTIAVATLVDLPTGNEDAFLGDDGVGVEPRAIFAFDWDIIGAALNVGFRFRPSQRIAMAGGAKDIVVGNEVYTSAGGRVGLWRDKLDAVVDGQAFFPLEDSEEAELGGEILGGLRGYLPYGLTANVGAGAGMGSALGVPAFRVLAGLHYQYLREKPQPVAQAVGDVDGDGKADNVDKCPHEPEDVDGFEDKDGCPDPDNDSDGILDAADKCPLFAEDVDGFEDEDGCPDEDNDGDGVLDKDDQCPNESETVNGIEDADGCPDRQGTGPVQLKHDRITVPPVHFATNGVAVLATSHPTLEMVATLIQDNAWIKKVRIEGHSDSQGPAAYNQKLSERRAAAVQDFLISRSLEASRVEAVGFGESKPVATNETADGRSQNRRVVFIIVDPPMEKPITE